MKKIAIIGGGASGLACAVEAAECSKDTEITVYEALPRIGKKILATGNGRCNLTNTDFRGECYHGSRKFAMAVMNGFSPDSNIRFFNSMGLYTKTDSCGRVYPMSGQASSVLDAFLYAVESRGIKTICEYRVDKITRHNGGFLLNGETYADCVVMAAGGKVPSCKTDICNSHSLLSSLGHTITPVYPSLVQLTSSDRNLKSLKGIRADAVLSLTGDNRLLRKEEGELLFTDYGLSGIVSMQLSSFAAKYIAQSGKKPSVLADFVPALRFEELRTAVEGICRDMPSLSAENILNGFTAKRIGQMIVKSCGISPDTPVCRLSRRELSLLCSGAKNFEFIINGTKDFSFAQVTSGGADTSEFDLNLASKKVNGLFCCGEALDVDGDCGGYNLQWAWSSGRMAGRSAVKYLAGQ